MGSPDDCVIVVNKADIQSPHTELNFLQRESWGKQLGVPYYGSQGETYTPINFIVWRLFDDNEVS